MNLPLLKEAVLAGVDGFFGRLLKEQDPKSKPREPEAITLHRNLGIADQVWFACDAPAAYHAGGRWEHRTAYFVAPFEI